MVINSGRHEYNCTHNLKTTLCFLYFLLFPNQITPIITPFCVLTSGKKTEEKYFLHSKRFLERFANKITVLEEKLTQKFHTVYTLNFHVLILMFIVIDREIMNKVTFIRNQNLRTRKIKRIKTKEREKTKAKISKFTEIYRPIIM